MTFIALLLMYVCRNIAFTPIPPFQMTHKWGKAGNSACALKFPETFLRSKLVFIYRLMDISPRNHPGCQDCTSKRLKSPPKARQSPRRSVPQILYDLFFGRPLLPVRFLILSELCCLAFTAFGNPLSPASVTEYQTTNINNTIHTSPWNSHTLPRRYPRSYVHNNYAIVSSFTW